MDRRRVLGLGAAALTAGILPRPARAAGDPKAVLTNWYRLVLELVRHTATYSPPVASRAFAYLGVAAWEAVAAGHSDAISLAGQLSGLAPLPFCDPEQVYDPAAILNKTLSVSVATFFGNTGPTGQRAMQAMARQMGKGLAALPADVLARSAAHGQAVADHIIAWSQTDGGAVVENMGFPMHYALKDGPAHWVPTSLIRQQQAPLLPDWAKNRPFAMPAGDTCALPPPLGYSEEAGSAFHAEAMEVYTTSRSLTEEQKIIARFWSDDPMLSPTPPGHWVDIVLQIIDRDGLDALSSADIMARLGVAMADAFIGCWQAKFAHDLLRPVTYIHRVIDPQWEPLLITPPFPEYPSGHSTLSGAAATVLTASLGADFAFADATHEADGIAARSFPGFWAAAEEAAISRLYGGIHFRAAIDRGLDQGACIGDHAVRLRMRA